MEISRLCLKQKVEKVAFNVNNELRQIIDLNIHNPLINAICKYAIDTICNNRDRAFIIQSIADICNISNKSKTISFFLNASELLIIAIYIKDDIIDDTSLRGGKSALHFKFGLDSAILVSDIFYSLSVKEIQKVNNLLPSDKSAYVLKRHNDCYQNVCLGQIIDNNFSKELYNSEFILSHYKSLVSKTYEYFCELPLLATDNNDFEKIKEFAQLCGLATQIRNDLEDIAGDKEKTETELLMDIIYGRPNYLISLLFEKKNSLNVQQVSLLSSLFGCKNKDIISEEKRDALFNMIVESSALNSSLTLLVDVCNKAILILDQLRDCEGRTNLINYMKYLKYE